jgi:hypothetical protein
MSKFFSLFSKIFSFIHVAGQMGHDATPLINDLESALNKHVAAAPAPVQQTVATVHDALTSGGAQ